jgi:hypothetical protein
MIYTVTIESSGMLAVWAPGASFPVIELETWEAETLAEGLIAALREQRWTKKS